MPMAIDNIPIKYEIKFEKDHASVKATYDLSVPIGGAALIADFQISVDGKDLITDFIHGQTQFTGSRFHTLSHPHRAARVSFSMSSNQGWTSSNSDVLLGEKVYDEVHFSD
jgi:hypothetical protein